MFRFSAILAVAVVSFVKPCFGAMTITITPDTGLAANPASLGAFNRAANDWSSRFTNNITINISAGLSGTLNPGAIANANSVKFQAPFDFFRQKIVNAAVLEPDDGIVAHLPTLSQFNFTLPSGFTFGNKFVATKANFKALGYMDLIDLDALYGPIDATILFNSNVAFDYDRSDGVSPGKIDFQTVATHELGHALGFISAVDGVDLLKRDGLTGEIVITPLDLFRFQNDVNGKDPTSLAEFTNFPRYLDTGGVSIFDDVKRERAMSTGRYTGDGHEASHWKDDALTGQLLGVMDPSLNSGMIEPIFAADLRALDLIGYQFVPKPTVFAIANVDVRSHSLTGYKSVPEPAALVMLAWILPFFRRPTKRSLI